MAKGKLREKTQSLSDLCRLLEQTQPRGNAGVLSGPGKDSNSSSILISIFLANSVIIVF